MYDFDKNCVYIISGGEDTYIDLIILTFNLYNVDWSNGDDVSCRGSGDHDFVEMRDGVSEASPIIAKLCGRDKPTSMHSTQNKMWIRCHEIRGSKNLCNHTVTLYAGSNQGSRTFKQQEQGL